MSSFSNPFLSEFSFNPRPPSGERRMDYVWIMYRYVVSIHAPPSGERQPFTSNSLSFSVFHSTPPSGERPPLRNLIKLDGPVSIHAPRVGSDVLMLQFVAIWVCFNPRPPSGERHSIPFVDIGWRMFQSTPPRVGSD